MIKRSELFVSKLFTLAEIAYCRTKADPAPSFAARFAAKEAVMKALGTGWDGKVNWLDIEVLSDDAGRPYLSLGGGAKELAAKKGNHQYAAKPIPRKGLRTWLCNPGGISRLKLQR